MKSNLRWFTITELIVIILIVWIISTISYVWYQNYTIDSRDTIRKSDMSNLKASLKSFKQKSWLYPVPSDNFQIINSWTTNIEVIQWIINNDTAINNISTVPKDPKNWANYFYSTPLNKQEFQIALTLENNWSPKALLDWDYKVVAKNMFPSLILALAWTWQIEIATWVITAWSSWSINRQYFIINWWSYNLPYDFISGKPVTNWTAVWFDSLTTEKGVNLWIASDYPDCNDIYDAWKFLWAWEYQVINSNWILYDTLCDISTFSVYPISIPYWWTWTITDTCESHPTGYVSSNTWVVQISWTWIITWIWWLTGQVNITPIWWTCLDNYAKVITVTSI